MLSKRDPIAAQLQLMRLRGDHAKLESKRLFHQSPMRRMLADVRHRLDESLNYRLGILRSVNVFGASSLRVLRARALSSSSLPLFIPPQARSRTTCC
jgi:hypothetical protein